MQTLIAASLGVAASLLFGNPDWLTVPNPLYECILVLKSVFLSALRMLIAPLIFFSLINGITGIGNIIRLRTLGGVTVSYYLATTGIAIVLALIGVFFIHPWTAYPPVMEVTIISNDRLLDPNADSIILLVKSLLSQALTNPFAALVNLNILGIVTNAFLIGLAMILVLPANSSLFVTVRDINQVIAKILGWVIRLLPLGIFAILFDFTLKTSADSGHSTAFLHQLLHFALLVVSITIVHGVLILPTIAYFITGTTPAVLFRNIARPMLVAFSTSSSSATLPVTMRTAEENLKIPNSVSSFVLPLGATMNMDGTALFEALAAVFLAYLFGIELSNVMIITIFMMAMIASIGAPGMPSASMAGMQMVLLAVGIPLEAIAILLVIERPLDTIRTAVNVEGDLIGALVVNSRLH
ncbi:MAG: Na+:H+ dicarboxylate symporter [Gammaproteobacteria bacterium]|nr:Na+:H+ dicarboxylate symporter [Gammaproteobacteria bacterium]